LTGLSAAVSRIYTNVSLPSSASSTLKIRVSFGRGFIIRCYTLCVSVSRRFAPLCKYKITPENLFAPPWFQIIREHAITHNFSPPPSPNLPYDQFCPPLLSKRNPEDDNCPGQCYDNKRCLAQHLPQVLTTPHNNSHTQSSRTCLPNKDITVKVKDVDIVHFQEWLNKLALWKLH